MTIPCHGITSSRVTPPLPTFGLTHDQDSLISKLRNMPADLLASILSPKDAEVTA